MLLFIAMALAEDGSGLMGLLGVDNLNQLQQEEMAKRSAPSFQYGMKCEGDTDGDGQNEQAIVYNGTNLSAGTMMIALMDGKDFFILSLGAFPFQAQVACATGRVWLQVTGTNPPSYVGYWTFYQGKYVFSEYKPAQ